MKPVSRKFKDSSGLVDRKDVVTEAEHSMELRYPKARLFVYGRLASESASCGMTLVEGMEECGLLPQEACLRVADRLREIDGAGACGSLAAAEQIIEEFMRLKHGDGSECKKLSDETFNQLRLQVDRWKRGCSVVHGPQCKDAPNFVSCRDMAPVVFDLLLQQLMSF